MFIKKSIIDCIGNTPLLKIPFFTIPVYAKLEYLNPGGSIKDRTALYMIEQGEKKGKLLPGSTIIEASSGNQGAAAAMIGNSKGYKTIITLSEKVSIEKRSIFQAYGAEVILCKGTSDFSDPDHYHQIATKLSKTIDNSYFLNQYFNPDNADAHFYSTGPEINKQIGDKMTYLFIAMGSAGTANGIARYMKEYNPKVKVIGVDAGDAYLASNKNPKPYKLDGMGIDYDTPFFDRNLFSDVVTVFDEESHEALRLLAQKYGILVGPSSGGVIAAILKYQKNFISTDTVVTLFTDSGRFYLSKNYYRKNN